jgi:hypothetical protein
MMVVVVVMMMMTIMMMIENYHHRSDLGMTYWPRYETQKRITADLFHSQLKLSTEIEV